MKKNIIIFLIFAILSNFAYSQACNIYLSQNDCKNLLSSIPRKVLKDTSYNYLAVSNFRLLGVSSQRINVRCQVRIQKWEKISMRIFGRRINKRFRILSITGDIDFKIIVRNRGNQIHYDVDLYKIHIRNVPRFFLDLLVSFLRPHVNRTLFRLDAQQHKFGVNIACYVGSPPESVPGAYGNFSYIHPRINNFMSLFNTYTLNHLNDFDKIGLKYLRNQNCFSISKPIKFSNNREVIFKNNLLSLPKLEIQQNRLKISLNLKYQQLLIKSPQGNQNFPGGELSLFIPVRWKVDNHFLGFQLADQPSEIRLLRTSGRQNFLFKMLINEINFSSKEKLRKKIAKIRIPKNNLDIRFRIENRHSKFQFQNALLHNHKIFVFFNFR